MQQSRQLDIEYALVRSRRVRDVERVWWHANNAVEYFRSWFPPSSSSSPTVALSTSLSKYLCIHAFIVWARRHRGTSAQHHNLQLLPRNAFAAVKTFHLIKKKREMRKILVKYFPARRCRVESDCTGIRQWGTETLRHTHTRVLLLRLLLHLLSVVFRFSFSILIIFKYSDGTGSSSWGSSII